MTSFGFRYPAVIILGLTVAGTLIGRTVDPGPTALAAGTLMTGVALVFALFRVPGRYFIIPLAAFVLILAAANAGLKYHIHSGRDIGCYLDVDEKLRFFASVDKWPTLRRHRTVLTCRVDSVENKGIIRPSSGLVRVTIRQETTHFAYGDRISFTGRLLRPVTGPYPRHFDYERYLENQGIRGVVFLEDMTQIYVDNAGHNIIWRHINAIRSWILNCFRDNLTEIPSALASGFLIGQTKDIPDRIYHAFRRTGTMHLLAVSGSNVALVLAAAYFGLRFIRMSRTVRALVLIGIIILFSHLSYNQPSVIRASIMAALVIGARLFYRRMELNNIIAAAATVLIMFDPANLFDIGFQLSFAVAWGLILFLPHLNHLLKNMGSPRFLDYILLIVCSSIIATLISAPITAYYFNEASLVTVASNLVVVPMVSVAVVGSILLLAVEMVLPGAAVAVGALLDRLLRSIYAVVLWFGNWEFAQLRLSSFPAPYAFGALAIVAALFFAVRYRSARVLLIGLLIVIGLAVCVDRVLAPSAHPADIEIFNSGSTQAVVINSGHGAVVYRQTRDARHDEFSDALLPYLFERGCPPPKTYIFIEPRYRTEHHLAEAAGRFPGMKFRPVPDFHPEGCVSVWRAYRRDVGAMTSNPDIDYNGNILSVQFLNSGKLVFLTDLTADRGLWDDRWRLSDYIIVMLDSLPEIGPAPTGCSDARLILLTDERREEVPVSGLPENAVHIVCRFERLEISADQASP